ncbi:unnamed protein product [Effrenium voratum]|uniref:Ion transport domain-containing protein n=1 Tax=Effrenium voratum TaxID=2562239 RepID=A0AA36IH01_9DINO|nr:unnamed protein product [Effrenium voratum]CAJ1449802.1 unnamed protein product [Effrenium voratum]
MTRNGRLGPSAPRAPNAIMLCTLNFLRFNIATIVCLSFFALEVLLSSFCKQDYFLGFFFTLDVVSTASLILDLTWVADTLVSDDMEMGDKARGGRTARLGASVGRVVRVIRLVRIVKLYKAAYERLMAETKQPANQPGDETIDDWDNTEQDDTNERKVRAQWGASLSH